MTFTPFEILRSRLEAYCNANAFNLHALKENLEQSQNVQFNAMFRQGLSAAIASSTISRTEYEALTHIDFDSDAAYIAHLKAIYSFLYEGGKHP